jgi:hypothetical protein
MSLLNLTSDGLPNILVVLYTTLAKTRSRLTVEALLKKVAPANVVKDPRLARTTLNRWIELGLFVQDPDSGELSLFREPETNMTSELEILRAVRMAARHIAFAIRNNTDLWLAEEARAADLSRSLAWLLAQNVYRIGDENLFTLANAQVRGADTVIMQNEARAAGLKTWGYFLGFIRHFRDLEVDPTVAIADVLPGCIEPGEDMPAREFIERLAQALPVLDWGAYRGAVHSRLRADSLPSLQPNQLSTSLSRALYGFMVKQTLQFSNRADVGSSIVFTGQNGIRPDQLYTWVKYSL